MIDTDDLHSRAKSVVLTDAGVRHAQALFERYFGADDERPSPDRSAKPAAE
jgi:hypothetical protein